MTQVSAFFHLFSGDSTVQPRGRTRHKNLSCDLPSISDQASFLEAFSQYLRKRHSSPPASVKVMKETAVRCLHLFQSGSFGRGLEKAMATHSSTRAWKIPWTEEPGRLQSMQSLGIRHDWVTSLSLFTFMQTHSSVLAWRIPGTVEPGGLPSMGLHRVRRDWSDLAAAAAAAAVDSHGLKSSE